MIPSSDLSVTISDSPDPVGAGDNISYLIAVTNNGPGDASGVTLTDIIPAGTTFVSFTQTAGPAFLSAGGNGGTVTATLANFPNGATATFELVVAADASLGAGVIVSNTVSITSSNKIPTTRIIPLLQQRWRSMGRLQPHLPLSCTPRTR